MRKLLIGAILGLGVFASPLTWADYVFTGNIYNTSDVDYHGFRTSGGVIVDVWAYDFEGTQLDPWLFVFRRDTTQAYNLGEMIANNDDCWGNYGMRPECGEDGSNSGLDSYIRLNTLDPGRYIVAICAFFCDEDAVRNNSNSDGYSYGNYRITVSRVPEPATLGLLGLGLIGAGVMRRRRAANRNA